MLRQALRQTVQSYRKTGRDISVNKNKYTRQMLNVINSTPCPERSFSQKGYLDLFDPDGKIKEPPSNIDYFTVFGLEKSFSVDTHDLAQVYKNLQRQLHPDRFSLKPQEEKEISETWSALVNNGYNWLLKPLPRALYLLEILGSPLEEGTITVNNEFLMQMMELNEDIIEAEEEDIVTIGNDVRKSLDEYIERIEIAFKQGDVETARSEVAHMKYYATILTKIIEIEDKLNISL